MKRDVIADNFDTVLNSPCFIEKGYVTPSNKLIYNQEVSSVNQIKNKEILLKDNSKSAWIVGYINRKYAQDNDVTLTGSYNVKQSAAIDSSTLPWEFHSADQVVGVVSGYELKLTSGSHKTVVAVDYRGQHYETTYNFDEKLTLKWDKFGSFTGYDYSNNHPSVSGGTLTRYSTTSNYNFIADSKGSLIQAQDIGEWVKGGNTTLNKVPQDILDEQTTTEATVEELLSYNNKIVKDGDRFYRLAITRADHGTTDYPEASYTSLRDGFDNLLSTWNDNHGNLQPHLARAAVKATMSAVFDGVVVKTTLINEEALKVVVPKVNSRTHLNDAPYDMFAIPYGDLKMSATGESFNKEAAMSFAFWIAAAMGSDNIYDLQLVPYCPCLEYISSSSDPYFDASRGREGFEFNYIKDSQDNIKSVMI